MNIFLSAAISIVESAGKEEILKAIQKWYDKDPKTVTRIIESAYPVIDIEVENYVEKTKSKVDNRIVASLKEICEIVAENNDFELPNLDKD